ncbi:MAG: 50S ribosomal protein L24 [Euryarchaeota archaeon RBG_16_68_12]|nr:MAG: 50S ribosomal protein L24 [Euryarchaeota archaeon RBG_16_68_12]
MVSRQPRKQRRERAHAPWHVRHKMLAAHVDPVLRKKSDWKIPRAVPLRKGDEVIVARGGKQFRGKKGKVISVDMTRGTVNVEGITIKKTGENKEVARPLQPSNLILVALDETDPRRRKKLLG